LHIYPIKPDSSGPTLNVHNSAQSHFTRKQISLRKGSLGSFIDWYQKIPNFCTQYPMFHCYTYVKTFCVHGQKTRKQERLKTGIS